MFQFQEIQAWLTECAGVLTADLHEYVEWETPLGLHVTQPYLKKYKKPTINTKDEMLSVDPYLTAHLDRATKPNAMKHKNAFPPNFVHSLDSTHMMLTALYMWNQGMTFASVHDCYWTHACNVEKMNQICREQFVKLHSLPLLEELSESFIQKLGSVDMVKEIDYLKAHRLFLNLPSKGDLDLEKVKESVYFFS